jgi:hypothetical protein
MKFINHEDLIAKLKELYGQTYYNICSVGVGRKSDNVEEIYVYYHMKIKPKDWKCYTDLFKQYRNIEVVWIGEVVAQ